MEGTGVVLVSLPSPLGIHLSTIPASAVYVLVPILVGLEYLGVPVPGESALIAAALLAATTHRVEIAIVIPVAAAGAIVGANIGFGIGYWGGARLLMWIARRLHISESRLKVGRYLFWRFGAWVLLFGRFLTVLRAYISFLAGVSRMGWGRFELVNLLGGTLWATVYGLAYYAAGELLLRFSTPIELVLVSVAVVVVVIGVVLVRRNQNRLVEAAERALPGPLDFDRAPGLGPEHGPGQSP
jgi:membrane protein DedA with SNARE-associated domain